MLVSEYLRAAYYDSSWIWDQFQSTAQAEDIGAYYIDDDEHFALRCMTVADNDILRFNELYRRTRYSDIPWLHHLQAAKNWRREHHGDGTQSGT